MSRNRNAKDIAKIIVRSRIPLRRPKVAGDPNEEIHSERMVYGEIPDAWLPEKRPRPAERRPPEPKPTPAPPGPVSLASRAVDQAKNEQELTKAIERGERERLEQTALIAARAARTVAIETRAEAEKELGPEMVKELKRYRKRRVKNIIVRVSPEEKAILEDAARKTGTSSFSDWARRALFKEARRKIPPRPPREWQRRED